MRIIPITSIFAAIFLSMTLSGDVLSEGTPSIKIENRIWDFGCIPRGEKTGKTFKIKNTGSGDLIIEKILAGCPCLDAGISSDRLLPGEEGEVEVVYDSSGKDTGEDIVSVYVFSNDPSEKKTEIKMFATVTPGGDRKSAPGDVPRMTSAALFADLEKGKKMILLDVREKDNYEMRHIPGAIWFPRAEYEKNADSASGMLDGLDKSDLIVVYCGTGYNSAFVAKDLIRRGYSAYNLDGISTWTNNGFPVEEERGNTPE